MLQNWLELLNFHTYAIYVWSAYGVAGLILFFHWLIPWYRWRQYMRTQTDSRIIIDQKNESNS